MCERFEFRHEGDNLVKTLDPRVLRRLRCNLFL
jgi:hypothetical protein